MRNYILNNNKNNLIIEGLSEKNIVANDYMEKIRNKFSKNLKLNKKNTFKNYSSYIKTNKNEKTINNKKNIHIKKQKTFYILPFINGDPNSLTKGNKEIEYTNKLLKEDLRENIPNILKVKDLENMTKDNGYFLSIEEIRKVKNYLNLNKKLNNLRKRKENMKEKEMNRIFKEFQRNNYEQRFNIDKVSVISALIGEDNVKSELVKQSKREKNYIDDILRSRMNKKIIEVEKSLSVKNIYGNSKYNDLSLKIKNMRGFENIKNN